MCLLLKGCYFKLLPASMCSKGDHKTVLFFPVRITRVASLRFYKVVRQALLWGEAVMLPLATAIISFSQMPGNITEGKKSKSWAF